MTPAAPVEPSRSTTVDIRGLTVSMRIEGSGEPLLLINGLARPLESWMPFARCISGRTVITFDAPGIGASSTPIFPLSMQALADVAVGVLDAAGFDSSDVVGFSHGGAVAQQLAADSPTRVRSLTLVSTSCGVGGVPGQLDDLGRGMFAPTRGFRWPSPNPLGFLWQVLAITSWSSISDLGTLDVPTLVVSGIHDRIVPPANSALLAERIPNAQLATLDAGHDLQRGEPARALARLVQKFLDPKVR